MLDRFRLLLSWSHDSVTLHPEPSKLKTYSLTLSVSLCLSLSPSASSSSSMCFSLYTHPERCARAAPEAQRSEVYSVFLFFFCRLYRGLAPLSEHCPAPKLSPLHGRVPQRTEAQTIPAHHPVTLRMARIWSHFLLHEAATLGSAHGGGAFSNNAKTLNRTHTQNSFARLPVHAYCTMQSLECSGVSAHNKHPRTNPTTNK